MCLPQFALADGAETAGSDPRRGLTPEDRPIGPLHNAAGAANVHAMLHMLLLIGGLLPLVAMLLALFAAAWLREGQRAEAPTRR